MIFVKTPYPSKEATSWETLGSEVEDYFASLDETSKLRINCTDIDSAILKQKQEENLNDYICRRLCDRTAGQAGN